MTVQQLIDALSNQDLDAEVVLITNDGNYITVIDSIQPTDPDEAEESGLDPNSVEIWGA